jgi:hypothetical protein
MERPVIYISGPMTIGDREQNIRNAEEVFKELMLVGYSCICPQLSGRMPGAWDIPHDVWIAQDLPIVGRVDAVLRLPGKSSGADAECSHAQGCEIPVYYSVAQLMDQLPAEGV